MSTDLSKFSVEDYKAGPKWKVGLWYILNYYIFFSSFPWPYKFKLWLLKIFGAEIGKNIIIKTNVRIKNPWRLKMGNNCWIGEDVWIDNLENVEMGNNVCLSQGAVLLTGNHDYSLIDFPYRLGKIQIEDGVWIGARSTVCAGVLCKAHSVLTVNSVATKNLEAMKIYAGNPAVFIRDRIFKL